MRNSLFCAAALLLAASASAQMPLPAFGSTYTGAQTRGFWFQAPVSCFVTGLSVPNESAQPFQAIEFIDLGTSPPPVFSGTIVGTTMFYDNSSVGGSVVATAIPLIAGNYYGVLGACTPTVGSTTSYNSYSSITGSFTSDILGIPTPITRFGTQFGIGGGPGNPVWQEPTGTLCRVEVYVSAGGSGTFATNTTLGTGCGGGALGDGTFYELFDGVASLNDLANTSYTLYWTGSGYLVTSGATPLVTPTGGAVTLGDDQTTALTLPFAFPCPRGNITQAWLCSNGWLSFETTTNTDYTETVAELLTMGTRLAFLWDDLNPSAGGTINAELDGNGIYQITYTNVAEYSTTNQNNVQVSLWPNGNIEIKYGTLAVLDCIVGLSSGVLATDPGNTDLTTTLPILVTTGQYLPTLTLAATSRPVLGTSWNMSISSIPGNAAFGVEIYGLGDPGINDMGFLGMPGCPLRASPDLLNAFLVTGSTHGMVWPVPNNPTLSGLDIFATSAIFQSPPTNPFGAITSNGLKGHVGDL
ncbi:MAG: hypothetical protein JNN13_04470 [Planctomycetes bacterium]|nr:hypothetical protein [Planctomycetota bacterium]